MPVKGKFKTHCKYGHEMTGENLFIDIRGKRVCKLCRKTSKDKWRFANREYDLEMHKKRAKRWRELNPEKAKLSKKNCKASELAKRNASERVKQWRLKNKEKFSKQRRAYYERNKTRLRKYWNQLYFANCDSIRARAKERHRNLNPGPEIRRIARDLAAGRVDSDAAIESIRDTLARLDGYCKEKS